MNTVAPEGENILELSYSELKEGTCLLRLSHDSSGILTRKIVVLRQ